jgi:hypothetical protein
MISSCFLLTASKWGLSGAFTIAPSRMIQYLQMGCQCSKSN